MMTIGNAMDFIKKGINDRELRDRLNTVTSLGERDKIQSDEGLHFTHPEFEDAYRNLLAFYTPAEAVDRQRGFKGLWGFLTDLLEPGTCSSACKDH